MNELIEFKICDKVMHNKEPSVGGVMKEVGRSPFGDSATTVYDELAVGYHLHLAEFGANRKLVK
jgi:hypothetical protein